MNVNPAEFILDIVSTDFSRDEEDGIYGEKSNSGQPARTANERLEYILKKWQESGQVRVEDTHAAHPPGGQDANAKMKLLVEDVASSRPAWYRIVFALLHRSFIKSNRDVVAYGIRIAMYLGLAIMMGTVWLRLQESQEYIQPFINAIVSWTPVHINELNGSHSHSLVLRFGFYVLHGSGIRTSLPRRPLDIRQRTCQWVIRSDSLYRFKFPDRSSLSM